MFESRLTRLEGFNNKISTIFSVCSTWPSGKAFARCVEGPELEIEPITFFSLLLFFFSFFFLFFSFSFHFRYNSFVMFLYIAYNFFSLLSLLAGNFLLGFTCRSPEVLREVLPFTYF